MTSVADSAISYTESIQYPGGNFMSATSTSASSSATSTSSSASTTATTATTASSMNFDIFNKDDIKEFSRLASITLPKMGNANMRRFDKESMTLYRGKKHNKLSIVIDMESGKVTVSLQHNNINDSIQGTYDVNCGVLNTIFNFSKKNEYVINLKYMSIISGNYEIPITFMRLSIDNFDPRCNIQCVKFMNMSIPIVNTVYNTKNVGYNRVILYGETGLFIQRDVNIYCKHIQIPYFDHMDPSSSGSVYIGLTYPLR